MENYVFTVVLVLLLVGVVALIAVGSKLLRSRQSANVPDHMGREPSNEEPISPYLKYESYNHYDEGQYRP